MTIPEPANELVYWSVRRNSIESKSQRVAVSSPEVEFNSSLRCSGCHDRCCEPSFASLLRSDTPTQFPIQCVAVSDRSARCVGGSGLNHGERYCVTHGAWDVSPKRKRSTDRLFQPIECPSCDESVAFRQRFHFKLGEKAMTAPRVMSSAEMIKKCPRQELSLIYDLRRVACCPSHSKDRLCFITPPRNRTLPDCFEDSHASSTLAGHIELALKSRRLDSHQHDSVYKTDAFLSRATSAEAVIAAAQA